MWQADPARDLPGSTLRQVLVIASTPRVASNFFDAALTATGRVGRPAEYLNPQDLLESRRRAGLPRLSRRGEVQVLKRRLAGDPRWELAGELDRDSLADYLRRIAQRRASPNGVFAAKVHSGHLTGVLERAGLDVGVWEVPVRWVRLRRRDRLAQAVSLVVAHQTGQWRPVGRRQGEPAYDLEATRVAMGEIEAWEAIWDRRLAERPEPQLSFWSEDLVADPGAAVAQTLAMVGEAPDGTVEAPPVEHYRNPEQAMREAGSEQAMVESPDLAARRWAPGSAASGSTETDPVG